MVGEAQVSRCVNRVGGGVLTEMRKGKGEADLWGDKACIGHMRLEVPVGHPGMEVSSSQFVGRG